MATVFPHLNPERRKELLRPPSQRVRIVVDTDAANEIDDQFALAWALLSQDRFKIEGLYAEPYSFGIYLDDLIEARQNRRSGASSSDRAAAVMSWLDGLRAVGKEPEDVAFTTPAEGMEASYREILEVGKLMGFAIEPMTFRGSDRYLSSKEAPVESAAAQHLIERAMASSEPLYVVAIGCPTNVASALLMEPRIVDRIVVTWTAGYPTRSPLFNHSFNLEQDVAASQVLFESGVPLVYLPGYYLGAQLRLSLPEMEAWVQGRGRIGDYLHHLFTHNPIHEQRGIEGQFARTWIIWDLINFAWLMNSAWVPSSLVPAPRLGADQYWHADGAPGHLIREAVEIDRDGIFRDFLGKLAAHGEERGA